MNKSAVLFEIRKDISGLFYMPVTKILVDFREQDVFAQTVASNRRLLSESYVIMVWIYPFVDANNAANSWPPAGVNMAFLAAAYVAAKPQLKLGLKDNIGDVVMSEPTIGAPYPVLPLRPQLIDYSLVFAVDVGVDFDEYKLADKDIIRAEITKQIHEFMDIPLSDIRILSIKRLDDTDISRFSVELRTPSSEATETEKEEIMEFRDELSKLIKDGVGTRTNTEVRSVKIEEESVATIVDSVVDERTEKQTDNGLIIAIIIASIVVACGGVAILVWYLKWGRHSHETAPIDTTNVENKPDASTPQFPHNQYDHSQNGHYHQNHDGRHAPRDETSDSQGYPGSNGQGGYPGSNGQGGYPGSNGQGGYPGSNAPYRYNMPMIPVQSSPYDHNYFY
jgi:hypothetical protein